jgi:MFS family permease
MAAAAVVGVALGTTYPLFTLLLHERGISGTLTGISGAMTPLGMIAAAMVVPGLARRFGIRSLTAGSLVSISVFLAALAVTSDVFWWAVLRAGLGAGAVAIFVLSETWICQVVPPERRARTLMVYTALLSVGFSMGPALLAAGSTVVLMSAAASPLMALTVLLFADRGEVPQLDGVGSLPVGQLLRGLSTLLVPVLAVSVFDSVTLQFLPAYGELSGLSTAAAALLLAALLAGQVVLPFPLGWLADRVNIRHALAVSLCGGALGSLLLPVLVGEGTSALVVVGIWGGVAFAAYPLTLALLGDGHAGKNLIMANTAFAIVWGIGGVVGPPYAGVALDLFGPNGIPWAMAALFIAALAVLASRLRSSAAGRAVSFEQQSSF